MKCPVFGATYECIDGVVYGPCDSENCDYPCEPAWDCDCEGCENVDCCAKDDDDG